MQTRDSSTLEPRSRQAPIAVSQTEFWLNRVDAAQPAGNATPISGVHPCRRGLNAHGDSRWDEAHINK
jgi:hypothetical protein